MIVVLKKVDQTFTPNIICVKLSQNNNLYQQAIKY